MKPRSKAYFERRRALRELAQPTDLKSLLLTELRAARSVVVKKDIIQMLFTLEEKTAKAAASA